MKTALTHSAFPNLIARGKVRDIYDLGDDLLIVASDRISAFDVVMAEPIPGKGRILTEITRHWLTTLDSCSPHHLKYICDPTHGPSAYSEFADELAGRAMVVKKALVLPIECVVRGYLAGGGWKEYGATGRVSGIALPPGLQQAQRLAQPLFTPSTKAAHGHDEPISFDRGLQLAAAFAEGHGFSPRAGESWLRAARERALAIYVAAREYADAHGIIIADTKFEFGICEGELILVDEVLTPDSSRFWPADTYRTGISPPSFDKQFLRDYLETLPNWNKQPPPPPLPHEVIVRTAEKYAEALARLTGAPQ